MFVKNRNFRQKSKFSSKIEIFVKNRNVRQKSKCSSKIEMFVKNRNFRQKSKCSSKIEMFVKNRNFRQKTKCSSKIEIFVKNRNFRQKSKCSSKIEIFVKNRNFRQKALSRFKVKIFCQKSRFRPKITWVEFRFGLNFSKPVSTSIIGQLCINFYIFIFASADLVEFFFPNLFLNFTYCEDNLGINIVIKQCLFQFRSNWNLAKNFKHVYTKNYTTVARTSPSLLHTKFKIACSNFLTKISIFDQNFNRKNDIHG